MTERYELSKERIEEIVTEAEGLCVYGPFFVSVSRYVKGLLSIFEDIKVNGPIGNKSLEDLRKRNDFLYGPIYPEAVKASLIKESDVFYEGYDKSFLNPDYAYKMYGETGTYLSAVFAEIFGMIPYVFEGDIEEIVIRTELLLEIYGTVKNACEDGEEVKSDTFKDILYYYVFDYTEDESLKRINKQLTIDNAYANKIIETVK